MREKLKITEGIFPMPVLMIATYNEDGSVNVMNAAWGTMQERDTVVLNLTESHKTIKNIKARKAFTVSIADSANIVPADFFGIATGNKMPDKFERSGCTAVKSEFVNAPVITDFPVAIECELAEVVKTENMHCVVGKIVNASADEKVVGEDGKIDPEKVDALIFDQFRSGYYKVGEKAGQAWNAGKELMK